MQFALRRTVALLLFTHLSIVSCQQFDVVTGCIPIGTKIIFKKTLSCPCYLGYSLYSPNDTDITTDFLLLTTREYKLWQRNNFTNPPSVIHQHSIFNVSTTSSLFQTPLETASGSYTFVIRTHASTNECSINLLHLFTQIPSCANHRDNKIIGGVPIPSLTKHMAILESDTGFCSGTILSNQHILTAAHCDIKTGTARIGTPTGPLYKVKSFHKHPSYHASSALPLFDIGIITLNTTITPTDGTALPFATHATISGNVTITGFGQTHERIPGTALRELRAVEVSKITLSTCRNQFTQHGFPDVGRALSKGMLCLGGSCGDSCYGDSGGGALVKDDDGGFVVVGVVSAGIGCGRKGLPGVYTSVTEFAEWVEDIVGRKGVVVGRGMKDDGDVRWVGIGVVIGMVGVLVIAGCANCGFGRLWRLRKENDRKMGNDG